MVTLEIPLNKTQASLIDPFNIIDLIPIIITSYTFTAIDCMWDFFSLLPLLCF